MLLALSFTRILKKSTLHKTDFEITTILVHCLFAFLLGKLAQCRIYVFYCQFPSLSSLFYSWKGQAAFSRNSFAASCDGLWYPIWCSVIGRCVRTGQWPANGGRSASDSLNLFKSQHSTGHLWRVCKWLSIHARVSEVNRPSWSGLQVTLKTCLSLNTIVSWLHGYDRRRVALELCCELQYSQNLKYFGICSMWNKTRGVEITVVSLIHLGC